VSSTEGPRTGRPPFRADRGMVATSHYLASEAGLAALRNGGSAVDAAIAANAVLCVVYPHMAGLGGDAFMLVAQRDGRVDGLNASGPSAARASRDFYADQGTTDVIPSRGAQAALTVPGAVDGWRMAHERHGRLEWRLLFTDAIRHARDGFAVPRSLAEWTAKDVPDLREHEATAAIYLDQGAARRTGERMRNPDLATAFELIAERGARAGFYEGALAEQLCSGLSEQSPLEPSDFAEYQAEWVEPIRSTYRGYEVLEMPPNTQGFAALQILGMLEGFDIAAWPDNGAEFLHHTAEAVKLAFADRDAWLTDPRFFNIPIEDLTSSAYLQRRREQIKRDSAMTMEEVQPGIAPDISSARQSVQGDTCYLTAADETGLTVSLIQSIYHDFGSAIVPAGTGIIMQNRGSFFSLDQDHPNRLEPGKRTFHTLIPSMVLKDGTPWASLGTMGGEGQPQTHAALITRLIDRGYDVQQAIEAPRWLMGRTWGAESRDLWLEGRISDTVVAELKRRGQPVAMLPDWDDNCGHAQAIRIHEHGYFEGGADPRGDGLALGF
jgi:gamma-glutamyltranspeptidase